MQTDLLANVPTVALLNALQWNWRRARLARKMAETSRIGRFRDNMARDAARYDANADGIATYLEGRTNA